MGCPLFGSLRKMCTFHFIRPIKASFVEKVGVGREGQNGKTLVPCLVDLSVKQRRRQDVGAGILVVHSVIKQRHRQDVGAGILVVLSVRQMKRQDVGAIRCIGEILHNGCSPSLCQAGERRKPTATGAAHYSQFHFTESPCTEMCIPGLVRLD